MTSAYFTLTNENIDQYVTLVREVGTKKNAEQKLLTATCLTLEEIMLNYQSHFGTEQELHLKIKKRSGQLVLLLDLVGKAYNPIEKVCEENDNFIIDMLGLAPHYAYSLGVNRISISLVITEGRSELSAILVSVVLGALFGMVGKMLPANILELCKVVTDAISSAIFGLMSMAAMPVIFLCVVYGILGSGSISSFRESGLRVLKKMMLSMLLMLLLATAISMAIFHIRVVATTSDVTSFQALVDTLFSLVPNNIVAPFMNSDNIKVIILGVIFGCALLASGEKVNLLSEISRQSKEVSALIMAWVGKLIPLLIVVVLTGIIWSGDLNLEILELWKILVAYLLCVLLVLSLTAVRVARKRNLPLKAVLSAVFIPGMKGLASASSMFCYSDMEEGLRKKLGTSESSVNFGIPIGLAFYQPILILYAIFVLYFANSSDISINTGWIFSFLLLCFVTSVAAPPVSGSSVSLLTILFASLGVNDPRIAMAYPLFMLMDYPNTAFRVMMLMLEVAKE